MLIPNGYADLQLFFTISGDSEVMQTHVGLDVSDSGGNYQAALEAAVDHYVAEVLPAHATACTLIGGNLVVGQDGGDPITFEYGINEAGDDGDFPFPPNVATLVRKVTALGGRRGRGRFYLPGVALMNNVTEAGLIGDTFFNGFQVRLTDWYDALVNETVPGPLGPVLLHSEAPSSPAVITAFELQRKVATQRRRLRP